MKLSFNVPELSHPQLVPAAVDRCLAQWTILVENLVRPLCSNSIGNNDVDPVRLRRTCKALVVRTGAGNLLKYEYIRDHLRKYKNLTYHPGGPIHYDLAVQEDCRRLFLLGAGHVADEITVFFDEGLLDGRHYSFNRNANPRQDRQVQAPADLFVIPALRAILEEEGAVDFEKW